MSSDQKASLLAESKRRTLSLLKKRKEGSFLQDVKDELKKVSWTSKGELTLCTKIVIGATAAFGIAIYLADLIIKGSLNGISALFHRLVG